MESQNSLFLLTHLMYDIVKAYCDTGEPAETHLALNLTEPTQVMVPMPSFAPQKAQPEHALWGSAASLS